MRRIRSDNSVRILREVSPCSCRCQDVCAPDTIVAEIDRELVCEVKRELDRYSSLFPKGQRLCGQLLNLPSKTP